MTTDNTTKEEAPPSGSGAGVVVKEVKIDDSNLCWVCKKHPISYQPQTCDCAIYCKECAMKMATGGICKKCKKMYPGMRRMR